MGWDFIATEDVGPFGFSVCKSNCQCDGNRVCVNGCCNGLARTPKQTNDYSERRFECLNPYYNFDEGKNNFKCTNNC